MIPKGVAEASKIFLRYAYFYQNDVATRSTKDVTGGSIAAWLQSISGGSAVNLLVTFYDVHGKKGEVLFFCSVPETTRERYLESTKNFKILVCKFVLSRDLRTGVGPKQREKIYIYRLSVVVLKFVLSNKILDKCQSRLELSPTVDQLGNSKH
jgi:hypothetical protein